MRYLSLFSGIEAASVAWGPLGWECAAVSEIERFPCAVLAHHYPNVPNLGDVTKITEEQIKALGRIDLVVFGSPCQDLSIAGKRKGLQGARSGLFHAAIEIVRWARGHGGCRFALWENVPGAYSSNQGRDFACVVGEMAGLTDVGVPAHGWGTEGCAVGDDGMVEWCCLDAQWFGVAQRRRRVFALADFGAWWSRRPILLEPQSMRRDTAPSREAGQETAGTLASRTGAGGFPGTDEACSGYLQAIAYGGNNTSGSIDVATARNACANASGRMDFETETFIVEPRRKRLDFDAETPALSVALRGREGGATAELGDDVAGCLRASTGGGDKPHVLAVCVTGDITHTLKAEGFDASEDRTGRGWPIIAAFAENSRGELRFEGGDGARCGTLSTGGGKPGQGTPTALVGMTVRRLMPVECERLQAFPDGYTDVPKAADGPRYKSLGNSMCVNVMAFIGRRIQQEAA